MDEIVVLRQTIFDRGTREVCITRCGGSCGQGRRAADTPDLGYFEIKRPDYFRLADRIPKLTYMAMGANNIIYFCPFGIVSATRNGILISEVIFEGRLAGRSTIEAKVFKLAD